MWKNYDKEREDREKDHPLSFSLFFLGSWVLCSFGRLSFLIRLGKDARKNEPNKDQEKENDGWSFPYKKKQKTNEKTEHPQITEHPNIGLHLHYPVNFGQKPRKVNQKEMKVYKSWEVPWIILDVHWLSFHWSSFFL